MGFACVNSDNFGGAYLMTKYLIERGYGRIAFISGPQTHYSIAQRVQGYRHALLAHGLIPHPHLEVPRAPLDEEEGTESAVLRLLGQQERPDAIFAFNDATALQALRTCQMQGLRVPEDTAVVGFDDLSSAPLSFPPLTTVRVDKEALGSRGVEVLLNPASAGTLITLPVSLVIRESAVGAGPRSADSR
ncbi:substrate-binding domain-containing protein [Deinococcus hopiensis]|uniref:substrate-binding domain-containing protein n=1 Tax=Deinococcus hopiensis TaxID=309885 RepID=UPI002481ECF4|nr:substrate-binding domain-containing protein [Deinococcus hopiensis]